ncbi:MAG: D-aminoacylase [Bacteroidales bacterium]|jgi:N-acyl-D-amino-acid deacylase
MFRIPTLLLLLVLASCQQQANYDLILRNGTVYDGSGSAPVKADIAIAADTIAAIGDLKDATAGMTIDVTGLAVAPGFINMLSWANETLIEDGRSQGDIRQGVTLEVFGEGNSDGPLNEMMKQMRKRLQGDIKYDIPWTTLRQYLDFLEKRGVSCNIASFVGATSVRIHEIGYVDRPPTAAELERMKQLVRQAMEEGAVGLSSALIYSPAFYAKTDEIIELAKVAAEYDGLYITHLRSEGDKFLEALDEMITIAREAGIRSEIYHMKSAGPKNWDKTDRAIAKIDSARAAGLAITSDMYTYTAAATGLNACMPPWVKENGDEVWARRLKDPVVRARLKEEISDRGENWENFYELAGTPDNILLAGFTNDSLKKYTGMTLTEVAAARKSDPVETIMDLVALNHQDVSAVYFLMSEENVKKQIRLPYMSFGSDAESQSPEGVFLKSNLHPRAYGNFARLLGKYVRDEKVITLEEAVRRLTSLPAENLRLDRRGKLTAGYYADVVIFDPSKITDPATYTKPQQFSTGMVHVFVNGTQVIRDGEHTGEKPGRVVQRQ